MRVTLTDRGMTDDKLICSHRPLQAEQRRDVLRFFHFYARCKGSSISSGAGQGATLAMDGVTPPKRSLVRAPVTPSGGEPPVPF